MVATLDYTYSENKIATQRNELSVWFNFGPPSSTWTDGPVAGPLIYSETIDAGEQRPVDGRRQVRHQEREQVARLQSRHGSRRTASACELDFHDSIAESGADSPYGSNAVLGVAGFFRGTTTADFTQDFPVMSVALPPGPDGHRRLEDARHRLELPQQLHEDGDPAGAAERRLGVPRRLRAWTSACRADGREEPLGVLQRAAGHLGLARPSAADYPDDVWRADTVRQYFDKISGSGNPNLFNNFFTFDFETVRALAAQQPAIRRCTRRRTIFTTDRHVEEKSQERVRPVQHGVGLGRADARRGRRALREDGRRLAARSCPSPPSIGWVANNEFSHRSSASASSRALEGSYNYVLPSLDFDMDLTDNLKVRAS